MAAVTAERSGVRGAGRHAVANLVGAALTALAGVALHVVVTRAWTPAEAGLFFVASSLFLVGAAVAVLGSNVGAVYFVSRYRALGRTPEIRPVLVAGLLPVAAASLLVAVLGWLAAPWLVDTLADSPGVARDEVVAAVRVLLPFVPCAAAAEFALAACRGFGAMRPLLLIERLGRSALQLAAVAAVAAWGLSAGTALPLAWVAPSLPAALAAAVWLAVLVRRAGGGAGGPGSAWRGQWRPFWRYTGPRALANLLQVMLQRLDIVLVGVLRGVADAAVYTAATRFLVVGQLAGQALSTSVQHRLAAHLATGDRAAAGALYQAATGWLVLLSWPVYLGGALLAEPVLALFGPGYTAGRTVLVVLALTMLVATGCGMVDAVLMMAGRTSWTLYNAAAAGTVNIAANLWWIPAHGILGAAAAWSLAILLNNLVPLLQLHRACGLHPFGRGTRLAAGLAMSCFGVLPLAVRAVAGAGSAPAAAALAVGAAAYAAAAWRWRGPLHLDSLRALRRAAPATT
ncbi:lipopolysaccharide biosynthesis protein [Pilimelia terevasa]|uniref:lipopolysaccharide biosynthesis protein n=1 Tax=Pilimelia terevasa TaxID=53372 RepID=UPI001E5D3A10|nr:polysaccharide biosynthesis C-terminal domain-containing protein [Pilimelia terevasa]